MYINNETISQNIKNQKKEGIFKGRLLIGISIIIVGIIICFFLPADIFFWFIIMISAIVITFGTIELISLRDEIVKFDIKSNKLSIEKLYRTDVIIGLMIFYFAVAILLFLVFASGIKAGNHQGWFLLMLAPAGIQDGIAFISGKKIGKHKIQALKNVSPNKTWEGTFFGMIAGFSLAIIILEFKFSQLEIWQMILASLMISVLAFFGDLLESKFKRIIGVKDSGKLLKGHGGLLDRIDSQLLVIYGIYALTFWFLF